jgi:putative transposase
MARKRYKPEEIVAKLRQVDVLVSQGQAMADAIRQIGVSEVTYYRWRQEFGGLKSEQVKRLKDLELENSRLRKVVSDLTLDKLILPTVEFGNDQGRSGLLGSGNGSRELGPIALGSKCPFHLRPYRKWRRFRRGGQSASACL